MEWRVDRSLRKSSIFSRRDYRRSRTNSNRFYPLLLFRRVMVVEIFSKIHRSLMIINFNGLCRSTKDRKDESKRGRWKESNWRTYNETLRTLSLFATNGTINAINEVGSNDRNPDFPTDVARWIFSRPFPIIRKRKSVELHSFQRIAHKCVSRSFRI